MTDEALGTARKVYLFSAVEHPEGAGEWCAVGVLMEGDWISEKITVTEGGKRHALGTVIEEAFRQIDPERQILLVMPHEEVAYRESKPCTCRTCRAAQGNASKGYREFPLSRAIRTLPGSREALPVFETTRSAAQERALRTRQRRLAALRHHIEVWVDASVLNGDIGLGCIDEFGEYVTQHIRLGDGAVLYAELRAIRAAATHWTQRYRQNKIIIHTDSQIAADLVNRKGRSKSSEVIREVESIRARSSGRRVSVVWSPGHAGDPRSEAAHRLANIVRREDKWNLDEEVATAQKDAVAEEMRAIHRPE